MIAVSSGFLKLPVNLEYPGTGLTLAETAHQLGVTTSAISKIFSRNEGKSLF